MAERDNKISEIMETAIEEIKSMVDADTIVGNPIETSGITVIPISKVTFGLASGGVDLSTKSSNNKIFGGGGGAGVSVVPICFLAVKNGDVKILNINLSDSIAEKAVTLVPELFDKIKSLFKSKKEIEISE